MRKKKRLMSFPRGGYDDVLNFINIGHIFNIMKAQLNQTNLKFRNIDSNVLGIGLFVHRINGKLTKEKTPDITYKRAIDIGGESIAFKFIPYKQPITIGREIFVLESLWSLPENKWVCNDKCLGTDDCQHLSEICLCVEGECI